MRETVTRRLRLQMVVESRPRWGRYWKPWRVVSWGQEFRSSRVQEFRSSGAQEFRSSGVKEFRSSGVQKFRSSGV